MTSVRRIEQCIDYRTGVFPIRLNYWQLRTPAEQRAHRPSYVTDRECPPDAFFSIFIWQSKLLSGKPLYNIPSMKMIHQQRLSINAVIETLLLPLCPGRKINIVDQRRVKKRTSLAEKLFKLDCSFVARAEHHLKNEIDDELFSCFFILKVKMKLTFRINKNHRLDIRLPWCIFIYCYKIQWSATRRGTSFMGTTISRGKRVHICSFLPIFFTSLDIDRNRKLLINLDDVGQCPKQCR